MRLPAPVATIHRHARALPPVAWVGLFAVAGVAILVWHQWANTEQAHEGAKWLDPEQPPAQVDAPREQVPSTRARKRDYPPSVMGWSCSPVGDC